MVKLRPPCSLPTLHLTFGFRGPQYAFKSDLTLQFTNQGHDCRREESKRVRIGQRDMYLNLTEGNLAFCYFVGISTMKEFRNKFQGDITNFTEIRAKKTEGETSPPAWNRVKEYFPLTLKNMWFFPFTQKVFWLQILL